MRALAISLCLLWPAILVAQPDPSSQPDTFEQLVASARQAASESRYVDAVRDLKAAYLLRQDPDLLLELGRGYRRLGQAPDMVDAYSRYRIASPSLTPDLRAEIDSALQAGTPNYAVQIARPTKTIKRPHRGMLVAGALLFSISYTSAAIAGGNAIWIGGPEYKNGNSATAGGLLYIPFIGPFASAIAFRDPRWVGPWVAVDGLTQLLSLALMIASRYRPETVTVPIMPYATATGAGLTAAGAF